MRAGGRSAAQQRQFAERVARLSGIQWARTEHHEPGRERQQADLGPSEMLGRDNA